jgi:hypothetical protein
MKSIRSKSQLTMSAQDRQRLLRKEWKIPQKDIANAVRGTIKTKNQRRQTIVNDSDIFWIRWNKTKAIMGECLAPIIDAWKKNDDDYTQHDWMDHASDYSQSDSLDVTRHKGVMIRIEMEEEDQSSTVDSGDHSHYSSP